MADAAVPSEKGNLSRRPTGAKSEPPAALMCFSFQVEAVMQPVFFVMAILGCGDGSVDCTEARMVPARYETMAQCRADLANRIAANTDVPYPVIGADCRRMGAQMVKTERKPTKG
ncbi:hypothetical protein [uncultured Sphingomonas sp.]|jgi:hypothetical protein|uniref:hypothetical protein n=1 Tax=uncultured Sphingomonas sp. TaxID=158754 RepID=UPI0025CF1FC4|nr:hypothetical protein [uncultured Sphingomonas sp.]